MCVLRCSIYLLNVRRLYALAAAIVAFGVLSAQAQTDGGHWTVSRVDGAAMVTGDGGEAFAASRGQPVTAGTTIVTEDDSAVVLTRRGDSITVYPNSEMTIPATSGTDEPDVLQNIGRLLFRMETRESRDFEVRTPFLAATIKGTTFTVAVEQTRAAVSVTEGLVRVEAAHGGRSEMVRPGWTATVEVDREFVGLAMGQKSVTNNVAETGDSTADESMSGSATTGDSPSGASSPGNSPPGNSPPGNSRPGNGKGQKK